MTAEVPRKDWFKVWRLRTYEDCSAEIETTINLHDIRQSRSHNVWAAAILKYSKLKIQQGQGETEDDHLHREQPC